MCNARRTGKVLLAILGPVFLLAALELVLRIAGVEPALSRKDPFIGFAGNIPLFNEHTGPEGRKWLITAENKRTWFNVQQFQREKEPGVFRIFCLGGSTTYGRPYDDTTSFAGWLRALLPAMDPSRGWEVINAGGISYASYRVARLMEELVEYEPDLFIVYSGHNEFLERRTYSLLLNEPAPLRGLRVLLSRTRIYTVAQQLVRREPAPDATAPTTSVLPAEVAPILDRSVGPGAYRRDDAGQAQVLTHYRHNLTRMIEQADRAGVPVILVTPASNLADCSPFKSEHRAGLADDARAEWIMLTTRAKAAAEAGRSAEALSLLNKAAQIDDRHAALHYRRGRALAALERWSDALGAFRRARDEDVCPLRALTAMNGIVMNTAARQGVAVVDFDALVASRSPNGIPGRDGFLDHVHPTIAGNRLLALAILQRMTHNGLVQPSRTWNTQALERVVQTVEDGVDEQAHGIALRNLANVLSWAGKLDEAERLICMALVKAPADPGTHHQAGVVFARLDRLDEARAHYEKALALEPAYPEACHNLGAVLTRLGRHEEAIARFLAAIELRPDEARTHNGLGLALAAQGKPREAEARYRQAIELDPGYAEAHNNMGNLLSDQGELEGAEAQFRNALADEPRYADAHCNLGLALARKNRIAAAMTAFERALQLEPGHAKAHVNLGLLLFARGQTAEAQAHYEQALQTDPNDPDAHYNLGVWRAAQGQSQTAADHYRTVIRVQPRHALAHNNLGTILATQGHIVEAITHFERAVAIRPDYAEARTNLRIAQDITRNE